MASVKRVLNFRQLMPFECDHLSVRSVERTLRTQGDFLVCLFYYPLSFAPTFPLSVKKERKNPSSFVLTRAFYLYVGAQARVRVCRSVFGQSSRAFNYPVWAKIRIGFFRNPTETGKRTLTGCATRHPSLMSLGHVTTHANEVSAIQTARAGHVANDGDRAPRSESWTGGEPWACRRAYGPGHDRPTLMELESQNH